MSSAQIGKTEMISNIEGYFMDQDPSPILNVYSTLEVATAYSKDRLAPMIRDTACLRDKVKDVRTRDANNTLLHKAFPGGHLTLAGANSPSSLSSRPIRIVLCDEVDKYPPSAGNEGDPVRLAFKRSTTFWNRKHLLMSTPTIKGSSRIASAYEASDQRLYWVPCPACHSFQTLQWSQVRWPSPTGEGKWKASSHQTEAAVYLCEFCRAELSHADKLQMVGQGVWRAQAEFRGTAGFWINELYSPWVPFTKMAADFLEAKKGGPLQLQVFTNTSLAELWEEQPGEKLDAQILYGRREQYGPELPGGVLVLVGGIDVQENRIELEVIGGGLGEESWGIQDVIFHGATIDPKGGAWQALDDFLSQTTYQHPSGAVLRVVAVCVDTGFQTKAAYAFTKGKLTRRIYAIKGAKDPGRPIVHRATQIKPENVMLFMIGTDTAKATLYSRLQLTEPGPGYMHFPMTYDLEFFEQLTAEKLVTTYHKGFAKREWMKVRPRNEALDRRIYALAAMALLKPNLDRLAKDLAQKAEEKKATAQAAPEVQAAGSEPQDTPPAPPTPVPAPKPRPRRGGFARRFGWRGR